MAKGQKSERKSTLPIDRVNAPKGPNKGNQTVKRVPRHQGR